MEHSTPQICTEFLPISRARQARGWGCSWTLWWWAVTPGGPPQLWHRHHQPPAGGRGYKVGVLAQPAYKTARTSKRFGKPKYHGFFIGGGNVDSMVSHYSVAKIPRAEDEYSPGGKAGARPDRSATVYTKLAKQAYPDLPVILGGLEASLRRFPHYDYWLDTVYSIAEDSARISSALAWASTRPWGAAVPSRQRAGGDHQRTWWHLLPDRFRPPAGAVCGVCRLQKGGQR